jgi:hypothetical protein
MIRLLTLLFCAASLSVSAYDFITARGPRWPDGPVAMNLQLDLTRTPRALTDGHTSWDAVAREALERWNQFMGPVYFTTYTDPEFGDGNGLNEVYFSSFVEGQRFGEGVLAITTVWRIGNRRVEGDTIFNDDIAWDSYRGELLYSPVDFRRVALHEFGHTLGLDHPDEARQVEVAIMNSLVSDLDDLRRDDIRGVRALYPPAERYQVTALVEPAEAGTMTLSPASDSVGTYAANSVVTLRPRARRGWRFTHWEGDEQSTARNLRVRVLDEMTLTARFATNGSPVVRVHPQNRAVSFSEAASFTCRASSATPATYQWFLNGAPIPGQTNQTAIVEFVTRADAGLYACRITNRRGSVDTKPARLIVDGY